MKTAVSATAASAVLGGSSAVAASARAVGICAAQGCHSERDVTEGRIAPDGQVLAVPEPMSAMPSASSASAVRAAPPPPGM